MKTLKKAILPILFLFYLIICWYYGSAYILKDITLFPNANYLDIILIIIYFAIFIIAAIKVSTKWEKIIITIFFVIMLCWNIISVVPIGSKNPLNTWLLELFAFLNAPNSYIALKYPDGMKNYQIITFINTLLSLIPFIFFLFVTIYTLIKIIKMEKIIENRVLITLAIITCITLKLSTLTLSVIFYAIFSVANFVCWFYAILRYRNNSGVSKIFFLIYCPLTLFYIIQLILFQMTGFGNIGNNYFGIYFNELVIGPLIFHYVNLFPVFSNKAINLLEFICVFILFLLATFTYMFLSRKKGK